MAESKLDSTRMDLDLQAVEAMLLATQSQRQRFESEFEATGKEWSQFSHITSNFVSYPQRFHINPKYKNITSKKVT